MANLIHACESGHPHDQDPVVVPATWTRQSVNMGHFSRLRDVTLHHAME